MARSFIKASLLIYEPRASSQLQAIAGMTVRQTDTKAKSFFPQLCRYRQASKTRPLEKSMAKDPTMHLQANVLMGLLREPNTPLAARRRKASRGRCQLDLLPNLPSSLVAAHLGTTCHSAPAPPHVGILWTILAQSLGRGLQKLQRCTLGHGNIDIDALAFAF